MQENLLLPTDPIQARREAEYLRKRKAARRRQLVVALAVSGVAIGWLTWRVGSHLAASYWLEANRYRVAWSLDRDNRAQGGATSVRYVERFDITQSDLRNVDLKFLTWLHRVEELDLAQATGLRDEHLIGLERLAHLRVLNLDRARNLSWINNDPGRLGDATLDRVGRLTGLRDLALNGQRITDAGLSKLKGLGELRSLDLSRTAVTDAGLGVLKALPGLKTLDLTGTKVTAPGVRDFEEARPDVKVVTDPTIAEASPTPTPKP